MPCRSSGNALVDCSAVSSPSELHEAGVMFPIKHHFLDSQRTKGTPRPRARERAAVPETQMHSGSTT